MSQQQQWRSTRVVRGEGTGATAVVELGFRVISDPVGVDRRWP
jgi:hypothetical protein